ncbi:hypothetical protein [Nocardia salmonicida]|uniref:hypothetical protein n=1 Tax=Nocardia salmonicida TaxID=53431 RepID=UPI0037961CC5
MVIERSEGRVRTFLASNTEVSVVIERRGPRTRERCHLGSRDASAVAATSNGRVLSLDIGRGKLLKRSYRVTVMIDGRHLSLRPKDLETAAFVNGKPSEVENDFGELTLKADGTVDVFWTLPTKVLHRTIEPPVPTSEDVLIGYALAAAFGTGALSLTEMLMGFVAEAIPG